jgi:hypothetical protein
VATAGAVAAGSRGKSVEPVAIAGIARARAAANMKPQLSFVFLVGLVTGGACTADPDGAEDPRDAPFLIEGKADTGSVTEESPEAAAILELANTATFEVLATPSEVGLSERAADNIIAYRIGDDGLAGTADDNPFDTLAELDLVPFIGPVAFDHLVAYVRAHTPAPVCDITDLDRYVNELPASYIAAMPATVCVPQTTMLQGAIRVAVCSDQTCDDGTEGCQVTLAYDDVALIDGDPETLRATLGATITTTASVNARASIGGIELARCTAEARSQDQLTHPFQVVLGAAAVTTSAGTGTITGTADATGCDVATGDVRAIILQQFVLLFQDQLRATSQRVLDAYATTCE